MTRKQKISRIQMALGGSWIYCRKEPLPGVKAIFPRFHSSALVGVVNTLAARLGLSAQAVALALESRHMHSHDPFHLQQVILPEALVEDARFHAALTEELRMEITSVISCHINRPHFAFG